MITARVASVLCSMVLASSVLHAAEQPAHEDRSLRFGWEVPCAVTVTETQVKGGNTLVWRYSMFVEPAEESDHFYVGRRGYELISVNGADAQTEAIVRQMAPKILQLNAEPRIEIDSDGAIIGVEDWDGYLERIAPLIRDLAGESGLDSQAVDVTLQMLSDPSLRPALESRASEYWAVCVSNWLRFDFAEASAVNFDEPVPIPGGEAIIGSYEVVHHGQDQENEGCVRVSLVGGVSGKEVADAMTAYLQQMSAEVPEAEPVPDDALEDMSIETSIWAIVHPETMKPAEAHYERRTVVVAKGEQNASIDSRHYLFEW